MITDIRDYSKKEIINYLTYKAGSNNDYHFIGEKIEVELQDNLELQQVPREYAELLCFLRDNKTHSYLNIGIGNGGSFLLETFIQKDLKKSVAVDNMSYGRMSNLANAEKRINWLKKNMSAQIKFYNLDSSLYFNYNTNFYKDTFSCFTTFLFFKKFCNFFKLTKKVLNLFSGDLSFLFKIFFICTLSWSFEGRFSIFKEG